MTPMSMVLARTPAFSVDASFSDHWDELKDKILEFYDKFGYYFTKNHTKEYLIEAWKWINNNESEL